MPQLGDGLPHLGGLRPVGVVFQEFLEHVGGFTPLAAAQMNLGQQKLGMGEVGRIDLARALEILLGEIHAAQPEIGLAKLRVGQGVVGAGEHGAQVVVGGFIELVHGHQHASEVDQGLEGRRVLLERLAETFLGAVELARLVGDGSQLVPRHRELRRYGDGVFEALGGGLGIVPLKVLLGLLVLAQGRVRNGQLGSRDGVPAQGGGEFEVGILQIEGEGNPAAGVGRGGADFHRAARFSTPCNEHGDGVIVGAEILEAEPAGGVTHGGGSEGIAGAEQRDGSPPWRPELAGKLEERVGRESRHCQYREQQKPKHASIRLYRPWRRRSCRR